MTDEIFIIFASVFVFAFVSLPEPAFVFVLAIAFVFVPALAFVCQRTNLPDNHLRQGGWPIELTWRLMGK